MFLQPYNVNELHFAYCYRVYVRWRTHYAKPIATLASLNTPILRELVDEYGIHVLECIGDATDLLTHVSLKPTESISSCASKLKGRVSKWLREELRLQQPTKFLSVGYFACTVGRSTREAVELYLASQGEHHGYNRRALPPVYVATYDLEEDDRILPRHAFVVSRFHVVLAIARRQGILGTSQGQRISDAWKGMEAKLGFSLLKISVVPDHVHSALRLHPAVSPAELVVSLMNAAQEAMQPELVAAGLNRLWCASAYVGSYGELASPQIRKYLENWRTRGEHVAS